MLTYLKKLAGGDSLIQQPPEKGLKYIVVIPAFIETRLIESLVSLFHVERPTEAVEVIVVINWPEDADAENIRISHESFHAVLNWMNQHSSVNFRFHVAEAGFIPRKKAGVGYSRKLGMDEAVRRFESAGQDNGIIISFDADTICESNYLTAIAEHFRMFPKTDGCSIYFEHPLEGLEFPPQVYQAIIQYELHMRYYLHSIKYSGFPNAFYTVGSAFAVRAVSYCRQGGMNIRQAGEDFYFLQKFFELGNFSDLLKTRICPSPRPSLRVPFGTGNSINQILNSRESLKSYNPATFEMLKEFFELIPQIYHELLVQGKPEISSLNPCILEFLKDSGFREAVLNIYENSGSLTAFTKRFYRYFNMFRILKFAKHAGKVYPDLPVGECAFSFMQKTGMNFLPKMGEKDMLLEFRKRDRLATGLQ